VPAREFDGPVPLAAVMPLNRQKFGSMLGC
jgi:hypothetical protein